MAVSWRCAVLVMLVLAYTDPAAAGDCQMDDALPHACKITFTLGQLWMWPTTNSVTRIAVYDMSNNNAPVCFTGTYEGMRMGWNKHGAAPKFARVCSDRGVSVFTGASEPGSSDWMGTMIASDAPGKVGKVFHGFSDKHLWVIMPLVANDFRPSEVVITCFNHPTRSRTVDSTTSFRNEARGFEAWFFDHFATDSQIKVVCNRDCMVQQGCKSSPTSNGWMITPGSLTPGEDGREAGTHFYFFAHPRITVWALQDDTDVEIVDLAYPATQGTTASNSLDDSMSFSLNSNQYWCNRNTARLSATTSNRVQVPGGPNRDFQNQYLEIKSTKPILVVAGPALASDGGFTLDMTTTQPTGPGQQEAFIWAKSWGTALLTYDAEAEVSLEAIAGATYRSITIGPAGSGKDYTWSGVGPYYWDGAVISFTGELLHAQSTSPLVIFDGDYYVACCSAAHLPVVPDTITLPPVARAGSGVSVCPTAASAGVTFDGSGSFDQDIKGSGPSIATYTWKDVQSGSVLATGPSATSLTVQRPNPGTYDFELLVVDNEGETDTASVSLQVMVCCVMGTNITSQGGDLTDGVGGSPCSWRVDVSPAAEATVVTTYTKLGDGGTVDLFDSADASGSKTTLVGGTGAHTPTVTRTGSVFYVAYTADAGATEVPRQPAWVAKYYAVPEPTHSVPRALLKSLASDTNVKVVGTAFVVSNEAKCRWTNAAGAQVTTAAFFLSSTSIRCKAGVLSHTTPVSDVSLEYTNDGITYEPVGTVSFLDSKPAECSVDDYFTASDCCHGTFVPAGAACSCDEGWVGDSCHLEATFATASITVGPVHYQSFDGAYFDFFGVADFVLTQLATTPPTELRTRQRKCFGNVTACLDALSVRFGNVYLTVFREEGAHKVVVNGQLVTLESASVTVGQNQLRRLQQQQYGTDLPAGSVRVKREGVETTIITLANGVRVKITATQTSVHVPAAMYSLASGLLGNFNLNATDEFRDRSGELTSSKFTHAWGMGWAVDCDSAGLPGTWFYPGHTAESYAACTPPTDNPQHVYAASVTEALDQLAALGSDVAETVSTACTNVVDPPQTDGVSVDCAELLNTFSGPETRDTYLKNCLFDMLVAGGSDPSALLAVALSFSSQCEAVASTQQDAGFTPGDVADASGSLGFENTVFTAGSSATYAYSTDIDATPGWWSEGLAGVSKGSSVFQHNLPAPEGTHVAFVQGIGHYTRTLSLEVGVHYKIEWKEARRACDPGVCFSGQGEPNELSVVLDRNSDESAAAQASAPTVLSEPHLVLDASAWFQGSSASFLATHTNHNLSFVASVAGNAVWLLDDVRIVATFKPVHTGSVTTCPNLCSFKGRCDTDSSPTPRCVCNFGWMSVDCSEPRGSTASLSDGGIVNPFDGEPFRFFDVGQFVFTTMKSATVTVLQTRCSVDGVNVCFAGVSCVYPDSGERVDSVWDRTRGSWSMVVTKSGVSQVLSVGESVSLAPIDGYPCVASLSTSGADIVLGDGTFTKVRPGIVIVSAPGSRRGQFKGGLGGSNDYDPANDRVNPSGVSTYPVYYNPLSECATGTAADGGAAFGLTHTTQFVRAWAAAEPASGLLSLWGTVGGAAAAATRASLLTPLPDGVLSTSFADGFQLLNSLVSDTLPAVTESHVSMAVSQCELWFGEDVITCASQESVDARAQAQADGESLPSLVQAGTPHYWRQAEHDAIMTSCVRDLLTALQPGATNPSGPPAASRMRNATVWTVERVSAQCEAIGGVPMLRSMVPAMGCVANGAPCGPHGVCDGEVCVCDTGYQGPTCSAPAGCGVADGDGLLCSGHGVCTTAPGGGECGCWTDDNDGTGYISSSAPCDSWYECGDTLIAGPEECDGYIPGPTGDCCVACRSMPCDAGVVAFTQRSVTVPEGDSVTLTIKRSVHTQRRVELRVSTEPVPLHRWVEAGYTEVGSIPSAATPDVDYTTVATTVVLDDGQDEATISVATLIDVVGEEGTEAFVVNITAIEAAAGSPGALMGDWSSVVVMVSDVPTPPAWSVAVAVLPVIGGPAPGTWPDFDAVLLEGNSIDVTLSRTGGSLPPIEVAVTGGPSPVVGAATATSGDWVLMPPTFNFDEGQTTAKITVMALTDNLYELAESFRVKFTVAASPGTPFAAAGVDLGFADFVIPANNQPEFAFEPRSAWAEEGGVATATVRRAAAHNIQVQVKYWTESGEESAVQGQDFVPTSGTLTFNADHEDRVRTINVPVLRDGIQEDQEWFWLVLQPEAPGVSKANATDGRTDRIRVTIPSSDREVVEVTVALDKAGLSLTEQTAMKSAVAAQWNTTYPSLIAQDVIIGAVTPDRADPGYVWVTFHVHIAAVHEATVIRSTLRMAALDGSLVASLRAAGVVVSTVDLELPQIGFASPVVCTSEGEAAAVTLTRAGGFHRQVTVVYRTEPGTATSADFKAVSGSHTFAADDHATNHTFAIPIHHDGATEGREWFSVVLTVVGRGQVPANTTGGLRTSSRVNIAPSDPARVAMSMEFDLPAGQANLDETQQAAVRRAIAAQLTEKFPDIGEEDIVIKSALPAGQVVNVAFEISVPDEEQSAQVREAVEGSAAAGGGLIDALAAEGLPTTSVAARLTPETCSSGGEVTWETALFPYMLVAAVAGVLATACCVTMVVLLLPCCGGGGGGGKRRRKRRRGGDGTDNDDAVWANPMHGMSGRDLTSQAESLVDSRSQLQQLRARRASDHDSQDKGGVNNAAAGAGTVAGSVQKPHLTPEARAAIQQKQQQEEQQRLAQEVRKEASARGPNRNKKEFAPRFAAGRGGRRTRGRGARGRGRRRP